MNYKFTELTKRKTASNLKTLNNIQPDILSVDDDFDKKFTANKIIANERIKNLLNSVLFLTSGMIAALSMPGFNIGALAWFGFIPLISVIKLEKSLNKSLLYSYMFGLGFYSVSLNWFLSLHPLYWLGLNQIQSIIISTVIWLIVSAYLSCFVTLFALIARIIIDFKARTVIKSILIALLWIIIMNKLTSIGQFAFPWALVEYSQYKNLNFLQIAQYIGGIGIGFLIIFFNSVLSSIFIDYFKNKHSVKILILNTTYILSFILSFHLIGWIILNTEGINKTVFTATIIQNNSTLEEKTNNLSKTDESKKFFLSQINNSPSGIIVMPEGAVYDYIRYKDKAFYKDTDKISRMQDKTIVIGSLDLLYNEKGKASPTNAAVIVDKKLDSLLDNVYNKQMLVPFGEYIPFRNSIPSAFNSFINKLSGVDFYPGNKTKVIKTNVGNVAPSICYEIVFPDLIRNQVNNRADIMVNLSSLCWYHDSHIKDQFVAFSVMRAAEFRRPFIIAVNTGYSVFINFNGKIIKQLPKNKSITKSAKLNYNNEKTFFSKLYI
ncbi:MAG: apolipoprotein N-acyltransferase [Candidatus Gastranaerophilales bacterium]|nr:apolipoprotein N-acyltransferase [Candidatus Gastranaerophilales bacterium]